MGQAFYNAEGILTGVSGIPGVTGPDPSGVGSYNPLYDQSLSAEEKQNIRNQQDIDRRQALRERIERMGLQPARENQRGNQGMFGNPYMQRPMFGGGYGGGFNPFSFNAQYGNFNPAPRFGGFGGYSGFNPTGFNPSPMFGGGYNPYQQRSMFSGGFGYNNRFPQNVDLGGIQALINQMQRQRAQQAFQRPIQQMEQAPTQAQQAPVVNPGAADAARAAATAQFSGIPQGLGGTAQFQNQAANQMQTGMNAGTNAANAARAMATAQFSGPQGLGGTAQFQNQAATMTPIANPVMMNTGAGGGIVPAFGLNPMNQQGAGNTASAGGGTI